MKKADLDIHKILFPILRFKRNYFKTCVPPNRLSEYFFIDIKMCLRFTWYEFQTEPQTGPDLAQLARRSQIKNGKSRLVSKNQNFLFFCSYKCHNYHFNIINILAIYLKKLTKIKVRDYLCSKNKRRKKNEKKRKKKN